MLELLIAQSAIIHACPGSDIEGQCTTTQIGEAIVTAYHCVRRCAPDDWRGSEALDIVIIQEGEVTDEDCVDAAVGDVVTASGWPNTGYEQMTGTVMGIHNTRRLNPEGIYEYKLVYDVSFEVLLGYSGGPLTHKDGSRSVGVNYSSGVSGSSSLTVSTACAFIRGEYDALNLELQSRTTKSVQSPQ